MIPLLQAMRPYHWVKNITVGIAPLFAFAFTSEAFQGVLIAFCGFSALASGFYLINDIQDVEFDKLHPKKKNRPIAAGQVSIPTAYATAIILIGCSILGSWYFYPTLGMVLLVYALIQIAYNLELKHQPIVDIMVLASGIVLRALGGAFATDVEVSRWFILCLGLLAFYLGIEKRKAELKKYGEATSTRKVLKFYSIPLLQRMESVVTASALITYALWTIEGTSSIWMLLTIPLVAYAIFRYQWLTEQGKGERPEKILFKDKGMAIASFSWLVLVLFLLYSQAKLL